MLFNNYVVSFFRIWRITRSRFWNVYSLDDRLGHLRRSYAAVKVPERVLDAGGSKGASRQLRGC